MKDTLQHHHTPTPGEFCMYGSANYILVILNVYMEVGRARLKEIITVATISDAYMKRELSELSEEPFQLLMTL